MKQQKRNSTTAGQKSNLLASTALVTLGVTVLDGCKTVANGIGFVLSGIVDVAKGVAQGLSYENMKDRDYMIGN